jgi:protein-tyrosine phosphatase
MRDVYTHVEHDLTSLLRAFTSVPDQRGMVVFINGTVIGIEYLSQSRAFIKVFDKLLRSYAMDALQVKKTRETAIKPDLAHEFLATFATSDVKSYDAIGYGREHRMTGKAAAGSALTVDETIIHLSLLATSKGKPGRHEDKESNEVPFPRSYWVRPTDFLAGCYPGAPELPDAIRKLSHLLDVGIRRVINLMEPEETDHQGHVFEAYAPVLVRLAAERGIKVDCIRMPIPDQCVTTREMMRQILDAIDDSIDNDMPVYVHCWGGKGRTATVVGCWLARHGIANGEDALQRVQYLRRNDPTAEQPAPENRIQCNMVRNWQVGE